ALGLSAASIDVIAGGPPCQGFSTVGKRDSDDPRNLLWRSFHRIVGQIQPSYVLIENVEGLNVMDQGGVRGRIVGEFAAIGYRMKAALLRAADYGVPQLRKRMFFLGWRDGEGEPHFPRPLDERPVTVADAIFDLPALNPAQTKTSYERPPSTPYHAARRKTATTLYNHAPPHPP